MALLIWRPAGLLSTNAMWAALIALCVVTAESYMPRGFLVRHCEQCLRASVWTQCSAEQSIIICGLQMCLQIGQVQAPPRSFAHSGLQLLSEASTLPCRRSCLAKLSLTSALHWLVCCGEGLGPLRLKPALQARFHQMTARGRCCR